MSAPYKNIALAGATGNLGPSVLAALASANYTITILSRTGAPVPNAPQDATIKKVDFTSLSSLTSALQGIDALVSCLPDFSLQPLLIDAAIAAGVQRFLPSEFGSDSYGNANARSLPVFKDKVKTQEYLKQKAEEGKISYTVVVNGAFLDWGLMVGFVASPKGGKTRVFDGGEGKRSMTLLSDVGKAVVGVLKHPEETKDRAVYVQSGAFSQNQLLEVIKKVNNVEVEVEKVSSEEVEKAGYEELKKGEKADIHKAMIGFITVSIFREGYGGLFEKTDNELFGIKQLPEGQLEALLAKYS